MGNCTVKGTTVSCTLQATTVNCSLHATAVSCSTTAAGAGIRDTSRVVRIMVDSSSFLSSRDFLEYKGPVRVSYIANKFPGYGVFRQADSTSTPLLRSDWLMNGKSYYLLPLAEKVQTAAAGLLQEREEDHESTAAPAADTRGCLIRGGMENLVRNLQVLPSSTRGVWRVNLVISSDQLAGLLAQQVDFEALVQNMRTFAAARVEEAAAKIPMLDAVAAACPGSCSKACSASTTMPTSAVRDIAIS